MATPKRGEVWRVDMPNSPKLSARPHTVISQLEDAEYDGHSLSMLRRIAEALNSKVELRIVPNEPVA